MDGRLQVTCTYRAQSPEPLAQPSCSDGERTDAFSHRCHAVSAVGAVGRCLGLCSPSEGTRPLRASCVGAEAAGMVWKARGCENAEAGAGGHVQEPACRVVGAAGGQVSGQGQGLGPELRARAGGGIVL